MWSLRLLSGCGHWNPPPPQRQVQIFHWSYTFCFGVCLHWGLEIVPCIVKVHMSNMGLLKWWDLWGLIFQLILLAVLWWNLRVDIRWRQYLMEVSLELNHTHLRCLQLGSFLYWILKTVIFTGSQHHCLVVSYFFGFLLLQFLEFCFDYIVCDLCFEFS